MKKYALLSVGELLIDLLGTELTTNLLDTQQFRKIQGGSPANLAANMARLGNQVALVSCIGNDNLGVFLKDEIAKTGIDVSHIAVSHEQPTSIVVVSRTKGTPDFVAYRTADRMLQPHHLPDDLLAQSAIFHTTCFALSQEPAQSTLVDAATRAHQLGCKASIDANYAPSIWPNRQEAWTVLTNYCRHGALVKLSEDDAERLYGKPVSNEQIIHDFHQMGAELVCLTLGGEGSLISYENGAKHYRLLPKKIEVVDATGAGDAFWSGFLTAYTEGKDAIKCAHAGSNMAAKKLTTAGPLPPQVERSLLYQ
ncbi:MAG: sugar kinase [Spirosomataceae bacterium]